MVTSFLQMRSAPERASRATGTGIESTRCRSQFGVANAPANSENSMNLSFNDLRLRLKRDLEIMETPLSIRP
jgi:hypothetical protein